MEGSAGVGGGVHMCCGYVQATVSESKVQVVVLR